MHSLCAPDTDSYVKIMEQNRTFGDSDEGKRVVNSSGETVGRIVDVRGGVAYIDPDPDIMDTVEAKLGWGDATDDPNSYPLRMSDVLEITDDEVRLQRL